MQPLTLISALYGEARGYRRLTIRRRVAANERLTPERLADLNASLLQSRIHDALARFPYYVRRVQEHRGELPDAREDVQLSSLPVWTRKDQRAFFDQQERPADSEYVHQTSGSTTLPVNFHVTRESYEWRSAIMDRNYGWARAEEGRKSLYVWAAAHGHSSFVQRVKRGVHLKLQRRVFFDAFRGFGPAERDACCEVINAFRPESIVGYSGMLVDLARHISERPGILKWKVPRLVNAAEGLSEEQRVFLKEHLTEEVFMSYGSREFMSIGMECKEHAGYHLATDNLVVEVVDDDGQPLPPGETGRIVITDLRNAATPFIRYEIGDLGMMKDTSPCTCGKPFPRLASVNGRLQDLIYLPDGRKLTALFISMVMRAHPWVQGWQVVQKTKDAMTLRMLTPDAIDGERTASVMGMLREQLSPDLEITLERADELIRRDSGKVHAVISTVEKPSA